MSVSLTSSIFLYCTPIPAAPTGPAATSTRPAPAPTVTTEYTEQYIYIATAVCPTCPTPVWAATWTIIETCVGDPSTWTRPPLPPNFVTSTVVCDRCATRTQVVTCPLPTDERTAAGVDIQGDGVTASPATTNAAVTSAPAETASTRPPDATAAAPASARVGKRGLWLCCVLGVTLLTGQGWV
ncbi:hypothetical protein GGTG_06145 [Gaeumannomyces tritici R3-111a-1]|uniref:Uncharacterized protein n=1 Tax=Gaeumannomyces tritici (strain R3-111a-1) TaxID=644352 RepID=J3NXZ0_GAET3|nr:hypothetical protein GGTG_06145 [Gaeumannomyces tritici R3-111a-1]EJT76223.1 hypothetical protein GGTG_06145 [Gaeumannomyces tritici R3-111a-1]